MGKYKGKQKNKEYVKLYISLIVSSLIVAWGFMFRDVASEYLVVFNILGIDARVYLLIVIGAIIGVLAWFGLVKM